MPPVSSLLEFMGATIERVKQERKVSESEKSQEEVEQEMKPFWCHEKKNMEFYFNPQTIENHVNLAFLGATQFEQCLDMDVDMIPEADDLMEILMTWRNL